MLAARWGMTPAWISMLCSDEQRDVRYDDALLGLPDLRDALRDQVRRKRRIEQAMANAAARIVVTKVNGRVPRLPAGYRYRGYLVAGSIVTVSAAYGSVAEEGERGIVLQLSVRGKEEAYLVLFENGAQDWFAPALIDVHLAMTGLIVPVPINRVNSDGLENTVQTEWKAGRLSFWPPVPGF